MKEKLWQGADLIFDLDADHLPMKARSYAEMLSNVKSEAVKLLDFLLEDFGFSENNISIVFSGGRGYHIHVRDPRVMMLEGAERREIVDYVGGTGLTVEFLFKKYGIGESHEIDLGKGTVYSQKIKVNEDIKRITSFEDISGGYGWGKRVSQYIVHYLKELSTKEESDIINETIDLLKTYNIKKTEDYRIDDEVDTKKILQIKIEHTGWSLKKIADKSHAPEWIVRKILIENDLWDFKKEAAKKVRIIMDIAKNPRKLEMIENKGIVDSSGIPELFSAVTQKAMDENSIHLGGAKTDEPVTADTKRLIRMPSSLHGGSGMRVVPLTSTEFKKFEPLNDAVVFNEREIKIEVIPPLKPQNSLIEIKGKRFRVEEGINTLPEYAAIYLMCRGAAEYA
ncbi:MAG: DNA primase small subunit PriS [Candidatus Methanoperedens sp.]|nr:DNA primase small subunit PriS [Candidatus Methanoperedens sp.]